MNFRRALMVSFLFLFLGGLMAEPNAEVRETADRLAGSVYTGPSMHTLRELTDGFGGRLSGSLAHNHAAEWAAAKFRSYGIQDVRLESFTMANGWTRGTAHGQMLSPMARTLHLESLGWSPSTPAGGVKGEVVVVEDVTPETLKAQAEKFKGKIVLLNLSKILAHGWVKALPALEQSYPFFRNAGAVGLVFSDRDRNNVLNATSGYWGADLLPLPGAQIGMEDWQLIRRSLENGPVTVEFELQNVTPGPTEVHNVIAEIRGSQQPDEWILIGAHLDSWDYGTGAQDNGTGSVMVLEVARAIAALGQKPRRSIRFALWGGEEEGLLGSYAYTQAHLGELSKCVAVLNTDNGSGHPKGWKVESREDLKTAMQPISDSVLKDIGGGDLSLETTYDTDHGPFMLQGIPVLDLWVDMKPYFEVHHKSSDTYDKVDPVDFKAGGAIVAATAWVVAQDPKPIAPHIDHAAVAQILKKAELDGLLTFVGQWKP